MCATVDRAMRQKAAKASQHANASAGEAFAKLPTIQVYAQEERESERYLGLLNVEGALQRRHLLFHKVARGGAG